jgi:threonyl-tRNA synthetase
VIGDREKQGEAVAVRQHKKGDLGSMPRGEFLAKALLEIQSKTITL